MKRHLCYVRAIFAVLALLSFSQLTPAQEITGVITGTVKDSNGAAIAGANVTISDADKQVVVRTVTTNEGGEFNAPNLLVGFYDITVEAANFKKALLGRVKLDVGQRRTVDLVLEAGNISESVLVTSSPVAVELTAPTASTVINGDQVRQLSINNRNFVQLVTLAPGVTNDLDDLVFTGTNNPDTQVVNRTLISVNGARSTQNTFTVDGADVTDRGSNLTIQTYPSIDSIGEFKVLRSLYPAESGRSGGVGGAEKLFYRRVREDNIRRPLKGFIITSFEAVAFFRRTKHGASFQNEVLRGFHGGVVMVFQYDIDAHDEMGQWM